MAVKSLITLALCLALGKFTKIFAILLIFKELIKPLGVIKTKPVLTNA
jgi:hypothetical protein